MARPRKTRVEGDAINDAVRNVMADVKALADPVPGDNGAALSRIVEFFKASHPDAWDELRLCPLQHGLEAMIEKLTT